MTDIVARLRAVEATGGIHWALSGNAADEIVRLRGEVERLTREWAEKDAAWREQAYEDAQKRDAALARAEAAERERDAINKRFEKCWQEENAHWLAALKRAEAAEAKVAKLREALTWYGDQMCEGFDGPCGKFSDDDCGGCRARAALQDTGQ